MTDLSAFRMLSAMSFIVTFATASAADRSAADYIPRDPVAVVSIQQGAGALDALRSWLDVSGVSDSRLARYIVETPQFMQGQIVANGFAASAGMDLWQAVGAALGRETTLAVFHAPGEEPEAIVVSIAAEPAAVARLLELAHGLSGLSRQGAPDPQRSMKIGDQVVFNARPKVWHCFTGTALIATNSERLMRAALGADDKLATDAAFIELRKVAPADAIVVGHADLMRLRQVPGVKAALEKKPREPLPGMLFGGWQQHLRTADTVVVWAQATATGLKVEAKTRGGAALPETHTGYIPADTIQYAWQAQDLPRYLSEIRIERDWRQLFNEREALLSLPAVGDLVQFATNISGVLGGMDFVEDVLGNVRAPTRFLMARCDASDSSIKPSPVLPGFALIMPLRRDLDDLFERKLFAAAQSAVNIVNITGGQQGQPSFLSEVDRYRGYRVLISEYVDPPKNMEMESGASGDALITERPRGSLRYNFMPCVAIAEKQFVVTTSPQLLRDIVDAISARKFMIEKTTQATVDAIELDFATLADLLRDNRDELVINRMLQYARGRADAEREVDAFVEFLRLGRRARLAFETRSDGLCAVAEIAFQRGVAK